MASTTRGGPGSGSRDETLPAEPGSAGKHASGSIDGGRFAPGTILDARYRIVGLLGRGGMGEVYRAEDLALGEPVAIKFLPPALVEDRATLARFHSEVRTARRITHPNVVRVHDIGEIDGVPFLTMEYVAGEDLSVLLRRIGRLPEDKATELSHQLCAGLAAAHDRGVLHRDLKPANVLIDGEGRAKIADFGLALLASELGERQELAGTPAYMAPEQLAGGELSARTDIFALGLVLYEMFTGKDAFGDHDARQLLAGRPRGAPARPSAHVDGLAPEIEGTILRCLEDEPAARPSSALEVSAGLPGGDPLALALAAGETPSPATVAAAPRKGRLRPAVGAWLLVALASCVVAAIWLRQEVMLTSLAHLPKSDEVLEDRARTLLAELGHPEQAGHARWGWSMNTDYLRHLWREEAEPEELLGLEENRPPALHFWYERGGRRASSRRFEPWQAARADPLRGTGGMATVVLDPEGRLMRLLVEPRLGAEPEPSRPVPVESLFAAAGLDFGRFAATELRRGVASPAGRRLAWEGTDEGWRGAQLYVEAVYDEGRPVLFDVRAPWRITDESALEEGLRAPDVLYALWWLSALTVGLWLARRHTREGRADLVGANRLALFMIVCGLLRWALGASIGELSSVAAFLDALSAALLGGALLWIIYLAFEPFLRRRWPDGVVSWSRLLAGRIRDPLVGRDVLVGVVAGSAGAMLVMIHGEVLRRLGQVAVGADPYWGLPLSGLRSVLASLLGYTLLRAVIMGAGGIFIFVLLFHLLRTKGRATVGFLVIWTLFLTAVAASGVMPGFSPVLPILLGLLVTLVTTRFGALSLVLFWFAFFVLLYLPTAWSVTAWQAGGTIASAVTLLALGGWGRWTAVSRA